ncbi:hypothetical protein HY450_03475 [Candidatus Pacearchaeota archaeon]|nr:hypothetical protein [Candidatus Pacearchaeota archaeon]
MHITSKGVSLTERLKPSITTITYKGKLVLDVKEQSIRKPRRYIPGKEWEKELEEPYYR